MLISPCTIRRTRDSLVSLHTSRAVGLRFICKVLLSILQPLVHIESSSCSHTATCRRLFSLENPPYSLSSHTVSLLFPAVFHLLTQQAGRLSSPTTALCKLYWQLRDFFLWVQINQCLFGW